jgi:hypothetical protein
MGQHDTFKTSVCSQEEILPTHSESFLPFKSTWEYQRLFPLPFKHQCGFPGFGAFHLLISECKPAQSKQILRLLLGDISPALLRFTSTRKH